LKNDVSFGPLDTINTNSQSKYCNYTHNSPWLGICTSFKLFSLSLQTKMASPGKD